MDEHWPDWFLLNLPELYVPQTVLAFDGFLNGWALARLASTTRFLCSPDSDLLLQGSYTSGHQPNWRPLPEFYVPQTVLALEGFLNRWALARLASTTRFYVHQTMIALDGLLHEWASAKLALHNRFFMLHRQRLLLMVLLHEWAFAKWASTTGIRRSPDNACS